MAIRPGQLRSNRFSLADRKAGTEPGWPDAAFSPATVAPAVKAPSGASGGGVNTESVGVGAAPAGFSTGWDRKRVSIRLNCSGFSIWGQWPHWGRVCTTLPGRARRTSSACATGMIESSSPHTVSTGTRSPRNRSKMLSSGRRPIRFTPERTDRSITLGEWGRQRTRSISGRMSSRKSGGR